MSANITGVMSTKIDSNDSGLRTDCGVPPEGSRQRQSYKYELRNSPITSQGVYSGYYPMASQVSSAYPVFYSDVDEASYGFDMIGSEHVANASQRSDSLPSPNHDSQRYVSYPAPAFDNAALGPAKYQMYSPVASKAPEFPSYIYDEAGVKYAVMKCETDPGSLPPQDVCNGASNCFSMVPVFPYPHAMYMDNSLPIIRPRIRNNPPRNLRSNVSCHVNSKCANCGTAETTLWRRGVNGEVECNACNLFYRKNQCKRPLSMCKKGIMKRKRQPRIFPY